jgi:mRNA interferase RelE/StbE
VTGKVAGDYDIVLAPPARSALTAARTSRGSHRTPDDQVVRQPYRVGKPLRDDLASIWSARRGTYRVLHRIYEDLGEVIVLRIEHRRDADRPL